MIRPATILEIGTFTGYSGICLARGLAEGGVLHTIDINDENMEMARKYFSLAGLADRIIPHTGDARDIIPRIGDSFDLVFIDGDKEQYLSYYHAVFQKLNTGGFILADNVLWGGKVLHDAKYPDKETQGILEFNTFVTQDARVEKLLIPIRDGLFLLRKVSG
jgi:predicted O-methyltransferase YrrM